MRAVIQREQSMAWALFRFWVLVRLSVSCALKRVASREDGSRAHESPRPYFYTHHAERHFRAVGL